MVRLENVSKIYHKNKKEIKALDNINLQVKQNEFVVIRGASGSGKTTLLLTIGGMLHPSSGISFIDGHDIYAQSEKKLSRFRAKNIGFIFQLFYLLPYLDVLENVLLSAEVADHHKSQADALNLLQHLNLQERIYHKPFELSTGERQRVAIARALLNQPKLLLADEPTGNLDPDNAAEVVHYLAKYQSDGGTIILVTHGTIADAHADRIVHLTSGQIDESVD